MMKELFLIGVLLVLIPATRAADLAGVSVDDQVVAENGETLLLNGVGLREKFWVNVYVGSLYLAARSDNVGEILSASNASRIQLDFVYKKIGKEKLVKGWKEGFVKNQTSETLAAMQDRIDQFYACFDQGVVAGDRYVLDYIPGKGTSVTKNNNLLGLIPGQDFKKALMEIWLGDHPADKGLKRGMLGRN